jgi:hypothetical protein
MNSTTPTKSSLYLSFGVAFQSEPGRSLSLLNLFSAEDLKDLSNQMKACLTAL